VARKPHASPVFMPSAVHAGQQTRRRKLEKLFAHWAVPIPIPRATKDTRMSRFLDRVGRAWGVAATPVRGRWCVDLSAATNSRTHAPTIACRLMGEMPNSTRQCFGKPLLEGWKHGMCAISVGHRLQPPEPSTALCMNYLFQGSPTSSARWAGKWSKSNHGKPCWKLLIGAPRWHATQTLDRQSCSQTSSMRPSHFPGWCGVAHTSSQRILGQGGRAIKEAA